jgi:3',5'-cyclic-AMP phosphodiesterase
MNPLSGDVRLDTASVSRVIQLSDTHLMRERGGSLVGIDTDRSLAAVCRLIKQVLPVDALLVTGDLAGDEADQAYYRLSAMLTPLEAPSFWLPGNHDATWSAEHPLNTHFRRRIQLSGWDILMLNTQQPGEVAGLLPDTELTALAEAVASARETGRHLLVATHHPLRGVGCDWLDEQSVQNGATALSLLASLGARAVVISGHVHQDSDQTHSGVKCLTVPSTCVQFAPQSVQFRADEEAPGCRLLELYEDGKWHTQVLRVSDEVFAADLTSRGYA